MTKSELVKKIQAETGYSDEIVEKIVGSVFDNITNLLANNETVGIHGFGKFVTRQYGKRKCYNPMTGDIMDLKPSRQPAFIPGVKLRNVINNK